MYNAFGDVAPDKTKDARFGGNPSLKNWNVRAIPLVTLKNSLDNIWEYPLTNCITPTYISILPLIDKMVFLKRRFPCAKLRGEVVVIVKAPFGRAKFDPNTQLEPNIKEPPFMERSPLVFETTKVCELAVNVPKIINSILLIVHWELGIPNDQSPVKVKPKLEAPSNVKVFGRDNKAFAGRVVFPVIVILVIVEEMVNNEDVDTTQAPVILNTVPEVNVKELPEKSKVDPVHEIATVVVAKLKDDKAFTLSVNKSDPPLNENPEESVTPELKIILFTNW